MFNLKTILLVISLIAMTLLSMAQSEITWNTAVNISTNSFGNMHPRMALDGKGNPMVIWGKMSDKSVMFSRWNGTAFTTPVKLNPSGMTIATAAWMGPQIESKGDTVYVVVRQTPESADTSKHVFIMTSFNGGLSFSAPVRVDYIGNDLSRFPTLAVDAVGNPIVAFMKFNSSFMEARWVVARSNDFGKTFSTDTKASGYSGAKAEVCDCCPGSIISSGNTTAMVYRDNLVNIRDIWTGISSNNSASFMNGFAVDNNNWMIMSCPASGPDAVIVGDTLYSVFLNGKAGKDLNYLSKSSISRGALGSITNLTANIAGLSQQNYPRMATDGKAMAIVWKQTVSGQAQLPMLFTNKVTKGFPSSYDTVDLGDITNADVSVSNGNVFVVWQDDASGTVKYRKGTYTPSVSVDEVTTDNFSVYPNPASSTVTLHSDKAMKNAELKIVNLLGETLLSTHVSDRSDTSIDISAFYNGIYFIELMTKDSFLTLKFVKQ